MKFLKHKHFMSLLYGVLVALPLFAILGRVIYTINNKNAYLNYSGFENGNRTLDYVENVSDIVIGDEYYLSNAFIYENHADVGSRTQRIFYTNVEVITNASSYDLSNTYAVGFYSYSNSTSMLYYFYYDNDQYFNIGSSVAFNIRINITGTAFSSGVNPFGICDTLYKETIVSDYQLDNAFEYSISTFTDDNNFGNLDFFSWFSTLFLDTTNTHNMLYINFVNWYLNYTLFISLAYVLFLVLMWFVSFVRRLLENTQNMNIGGL